MKKLGLTLAATAFAALMATSSHASTITSASATEFESMFILDSWDANNINAVFSTGPDGDASGTITFTVGGAFDLTLENYGPLSGSSGAGLVSGGVSIAPDVASGATAVTCASVAAGDTDCFRIGNDAGATPVTTLFSGLAAGTYEFDFWEGNGDPTTAIFTLGVAAVPVPAAGVLFGSALLGAAFLRRRKLQKKLGLPSAA